MGKRDMLYRAGYKCGGSVMLSDSKECIDDESRHERNLRLRKIESERAYHYRFVIYIVNAKDTPLSESVFNKGFTDGLKGAGYGITK
jgi:hypothetical protein